MFPRREFPSLPFGSARKSAGRLTSKYLIPQIGASSCLLETLEERVLLSRGSSSLDLLLAPLNLANQPTSSRNDQTVEVHGDITLANERGAGHPELDGGQGFVPLEASTSISGGHGGSSGASQQNNGGGPGYPVPPLSGPALEGVIGAQRQPIPVLLPLSEPASSLVPAVRATSSASVLDRTGDAPTTPTAVTTAPFAAPATPAPPPFGPTGRVLAAVTSAVVAVPASPSVATNAPETGPALPAVLTGPATQESPAILGQGTTMETSVTLPLAGLISSPANFLNAEVSAPASAAPSVTIPFTQLSTDGMTRTFSGASNAGSGTGEAATVSPSELVPSPVSAIASADANTSPGTTTPVSVATPAIVIAIPGKGIGPTAIFKSVAPTTTFILAANLGGAEPTATVDLMAPTNAPTEALRSGCKGVRGPSSADHGSQTFSRSELPIDRQISDRNRQEIDASLLETPVARLSVTPTSDSIPSDDVAPPINGDQVDLLLEELFPEGSDARTSEDADLVSRWSSSLLAVGICLAWGNYHFNDGSMKREPGRRISKPEGEA